MISKFCPTCEEFCEVNTDNLQETYKVRGTDIQILVSRDICVSCGDKLGSDDKDQEILDIVNAEYRKKTDLLTPERIKQIRSRYNLSQKSFALLLGMSEATINRYEKGALQDQSHDTAIRACEEPKFVRSLLERKGELLTEWQRNRVLNSLSGQDVSSSHILELNWNTSMPNEVSEHTGFRYFDYNRFSYVVINLCSKMGEVCTTVINKLLFYTDFLNFKTATVSLTGATYRRLNYGPVLADYDNLLSKMESESLLVKEEKVFPNDTTGYYYKPGPQSESIRIQLTNHEENVLNFIATEFLNCTAKVISNRSHNENAWKETEDKALISYLYAHSLSLNMPD